MQNTHTPPAVEPRDVIADVISRWPDRRTMAADVSAALGEPVTSKTVHHWIARSRINGRYFSAIMRAAAGRSIVVWLDELSGRPMPGRSYARPDPVPVPQLADASAGPAP